MKKFACRDTGMDCPFEASAENEEELMQKISAHAKEAHGMENIDEATLQKMKAAIKEEQAASAAATEAPAAPEAAPAEAAAPAAGEAPQDQQADAPSAQ